MGSEAMSQYLRGTLDVIVLRTLRGSELHGYGIAASIEERAGGVLRIEDGALYQALHRIEERGLIEGEWGVSENNRRAKYYRLTPVGRRHLAAETDSWERYAAAVSRLLQTA